MVFPVNVYDVMVVLEDNVYCQFFNNVKRGIVSGKRVMM